MYRYMIIYIYVCVKSNLCRCTYIIIIKLLSGYRTRTLMHGAHTHVDLHMCTDNNYNRSLHAVVNAVHVHVHVRLVYMDRDTHMYTVACTHMQSEVGVCQVHGWMERRGACLCNLVFNFMLRSGPTDMCKWSVCRLHLFIHVNTDDDHEHHALLRILPVTTEA